METDNMLYYNRLREVPKEAQKSFDNGKFKGTDINPMWRIKRMTEVFGMCGFGWKVEIKDRHLEQSIDGKTISAFISLNLYVKVNGEWSEPIYGEGGNSFVTWNNKRSCLDTSDEAFKMAYTDAFSNATKQLGLGADVWYDNDKEHSTKYDRQIEMGIPKTTKDAPKAASSTPSTPEQDNPNPGQAPTLEYAKAKINEYADVISLQAFLKSNEFATLKNIPGVLDYARSYYNNIAQK